MATIVQIGLGPLGIQIGKYIADKKDVKTVAAIDLNPDLKGKDFGSLTSGKNSGVLVGNSLTSALSKLDFKPSAAIITTVSSVEKLVVQVEEVAKAGLPIVSTCEELSHPWEENPGAGKEIDEICKKYGVACLGTGVNPGFLMDYLPSVISSISKEINSIKVERIQDATPRRLPFQKKIGAGLDLQAFRAKEDEGTLRHVGLKESVYFLASSIGLTLDKVTESLDPVIAEKDISIPGLSIKKGDARGVEQISYGFVGDQCKITMHFKAAIAEPRSFDKITLEGTPSFTSEIDGGINGDIATCAITINSIKSVLSAQPGLQTMATVSVPGFIN